MTTLPRKLLRLPAGMPSLVLRSLWTLSSRSPPVARSDIKNSNYNTHKPKTKIKVKPSCWQLQIQLQTTLRSLISCSTCLKDDETRACLRSRNSQHFSYFLGAKRWDTGTVCTFSFQVGSRSLIFTFVLLRCPS
jgi:hypothetical protein